MKKIIILALVVVVGVSFVGYKNSFACGFFTDCDSASNVDNKNTYLSEQSRTEITQRKLDKAQPVPQVTDSTERQNLIKRLNLFNDPNKISYIYLINYGKVMAFYTIKGKVSSVNSLLTDPTQLINSGDGSQCDTVYNATNCQQVPSPDLDGTYGQNAPEGTIFFFTTNGAYVEWHGDYMMADQPLQLSTPPELVQSIK